MINKITDLNVAENGVDWNGISQEQRLSEPFIREFQDKVDWQGISWKQRLSEPFIREFQDKVNWNMISWDQRLSEPFIREFKDQVNWLVISEYQEMSEEFVGEMGLSVSSGSWLRLCDEEKLVEIEGSGRYVVEDGWVYGWKSVREDMRSVYDPRVEYQVGEVVEDWRCDADCLHENSFGLSLWDKDGALGYHSTGILLKVRAKLSWIKAMVHDSHKLRTIKLEILSIN